MALPILTLTQTPSKFSPVYAPNWFAFSAQFTNSTAIDPNLLADVYIGDQMGTGSTKIGRFKVPIRNGNSFVFNPEQILKTYVSYPYNSLIPTGALSVYPNRYVNEKSGFGSPTQSFPTLAPECDGIVNYYINYGMEYNPDLYFSVISPSFSAGTTYSQYVFFGVTGSFCSVGDIVNVLTTSGLYSYYNGTAAVTSIAVVGTASYIRTNQNFSSTLGSISLTASGQFTGVQHMYGTTSYYYSYNGTRQWDEKNINFDNIYMVRQQGYTSSLFPSTSTASNFQFMNDWGNTQSKSIPIKQGQAERVRFLADLTTSALGTMSYRLTDLTRQTYDTGGNLVNTWTTTITDTPGGTLYPNKCFTLQVFDGTETIVDGYYYKFTLYSLNSSLASYPWASIWYRGDTKCSQYENYRIKFLNRQGSWAYWNFNKDNKQTTSINRSEYKIPYQYDYTIQPTITKSSNSGSQISSSYTLTGLRGQNTLSIAATETYTLNSDWITEEQYAYLQQLITSPQVFIFYDTYTQKDGSTIEAVNIPIIITDNSYTFKTRNRDRIFNLTITYKLAYDDNLQNP